MASINRLYHVATMKYDAVKRFNDNMASQQGNMGKWQETDTKFGWWLLDTLHLDFWSLPPLTTVGGLRALMVALLRRDTVETAVRSSMTGWPSQSNWPGFG